MEVQVARACLLRFHWPPSKFAALPPREKALIAAILFDDSKKEKARQDKLRRKHGR